MINVDIVVQNYLPENIAVHYTSDLAEALAKLGWNIRVITALPHAPTGNAYEGYGVFAPSIKDEALVKVWRVPVIMASNQQLIKRIFGFATFMLSAAFASLLGPRPEIVIVSLPSIFVWPSILFLCKLRRIPTILLLRDVEPAISLQLRQIDHTWWARISIRFWLKLYSFANAVVLVHESQRVSLPHHMFKNLPVSVIDHGVGLERMVPSQQLISTIDLHKYMPNDLLIVYTGTFGVAHDLASLLEILSCTQIMNLPITFVFVGNGEQQKLMQRIKTTRTLDRVILLPPVDRREIPAILQQADVLLMSYKQSAIDIPGMIGSKFYEYCAAGKPVLVCGRGVASKLVESIGNGWRCDSHDVDQIHRVLKQILIAPNKKFLGECGQVYARKHLDKRQRHQKWTQLIQATIERNS